MPSSARAVRVRPDAVLLAAVDQARAAAAAEGGVAQVGEHRGHQVEGERLLTHLFEALHPGYRGWHWSVTVTRVSRSKVVTVDEVVLLPGPQAVIAPPWVPWSERVRPDDLGPGDLVPVEEDDPRLVPGWLVGDPAAEPLAVDAAVRSVATEVGLGRSRVLSLEGRDAAAARWYDSPRGPESKIAEAAPGRCISCGFLTRMAGPLGTLFGVCANGNVGDDGSVVSFDHGCGGHSDVVVQVGRAEPLPTPVLDTTAFEPLDDDRV